MGTLTVRENLAFSANLRLPKYITPEEKVKRIEDTITELGLAHVADAKIGNEFIRGISGGERKRTNIGMELITAPAVLFLDEPTTGLDASTANAVMLLLHRSSCFIYCYLLFKFNLKYLMNFLLTFNYNVRLYNDFNCQYVCPSISEQFGN